MTPHNDDYERELVQRCNEGDDAAWEEVVETFSPLIYKVATYRLFRAGGLDMNYADIDNIFQEVFVNLADDDARVLREFGFRSSLATWLTVITNRAALYYLRREGRRRFSHASESGSEDETFFFEKLAHELYRKELEEEYIDEKIEEVRAAISGLSVNEQMLLIGVYFKGLKYKEIAKMFHIPINSISPTLSRAIEKLRQKLEQ